MRTTPFGVLIESLQIDKLRKRWVARCLFLLVYFINAAVLFFEPGDSDFSAYNAWVEKLQSLNPEMTALPPMPLNLMANLLYIFSIIALLFFNMLISYVYTRILIGDYAGHHSFSFQCNESIPGNTVALYLCDNSGDYVFLLCTLLPGI